MNFRNSSLADYLKCPAMYYWQWIRELDSNTLNIDLVFGGHIHNALECYFKSRKGGIISHLLALDKAIALFISTFPADEFEVDKKSKIKNATCAEIVLTGITERYKDMLPENIIEIETLYERPIGNGHNFSGKIDLIVRERDRLICIDHKTSGRVSSSYSHKWNISRQFIGYCWLKEEQEFRVNFMHTVTKPNVDFPMYFYSQKQIHRWEQSTAFLCNTIAELTNRLAPPNFSADMLFPRIGSHCEMYSCKFETLCHQDVELENVIVPTMLYKPYKSNY